MSNDDQICTDSADNQLSQALKDLIDGSQNFTLSQLTEESGGKVAVSLADPQLLVRSTEECDGLMAARAIKNQVVLGASLIRFEFTLESVSKEFVLLFGDFQSHGRSQSLRTSEVVAITPDLEKVLTLNSVYPIDEWYEDGELADKMAFWTHMCSMGWSRFWPDRPQTFFW